MGPRPGNQDAAMPVRERLTRARAAIETATWVVGIVVVLATGCGQVGTSSDPQKLHTAIEELRVTSGDRLDARAFPRLTDADLEALAEAPLLREINLDGTLVGDETVRRIVETFPEIVSVSLSETQISDVSLTEVAKCDQIEFLRLDKTAVTDDGLAALPGSFPVEEISLWRTYTTDRGVESLSRLKQLRSVSLDGTEITDAGLLRLAKLEPLRTLRVSQTQVTRRGFERFQRLRPEVDIRADHLPADLVTAGSAGASN